MVQDLPKGPKIYLEAGVINSMVTIRSTMVLKFSAIMIIIMVIKIMIIIITFLRTMVLKLSARLLLARFATSSTFSDCKRKCNSNYPSRSLS